jgi:hypothetical protein
MRRVVAGKRNGSLRQQTGGGGWSPGGGSGYVLQQATHMKYAAASVSQRAMYLGLQAAQSERSTYIVSGGTMSTRRCFW